MCMRQIQLLGIVTTLAVGAKRAASAGKLGTQGDGFAASATILRLRGLGLMTRGGYFWWPTAEPYRAQNRRLRAR